MKLEPTFKNRILKSYLLLALDFFVNIKDATFTEDVFGIRDHPYITSAKGLGGWGQKKRQFLLIFAESFYEVKYLNVINHVK